MINGDESKFSMEKDVKILSILGILALSVVLYSSVLYAKCQSWDSTLYNKYNLLNAQFESSVASPSTFPKWNSSPLLVSDVPNDKAFPHFGQ